MVFVANIIEKNVKEKLFCSELKTSSKTKDVMVRDDIDTLVLYKR